MYKKTLKFFTILATILVSVSCNKPDLEMKYTEDLSYTLNDEGTGYYVSNGTNVDTIVYVPSFHNDLPVVGVDYNGFSYWGHQIEFE